MDDVCMEKATTEIAIVVFVETIDQNDVHHVQSSICNETSNAKYRIDSIFRNYVRNKEVPVCSNSRSNIVANTSTISLIVSRVQQKLETFE
jgi:hypothetical protein